MQKIALGLLAIALAYSTIVAISEQSLGLYALAAIVAFGTWRALRHKLATFKPVLAVE